MRKRVTKTTLLSLGALEEASGCLKTLAHPHRLRMLQLLLREDYSVGELANACNIPSHMASEHLGLMKDRKLLTSSRRGRSIYYQIAEEGLEKIVRCLECRFGEESKR